MTGNLLTENLISVVMQGGTVARMTLPGALAALQRDEVAGFEAVQPHQAHPWHAFLVQLAALALEGEELPPLVPGRADLPGPADEVIWAARLRRLTPEHPDDAPWTLAVEDLAKPAFLQPPVPEGTWKVFKKTLHTPDDLDMLISARNHGLKSSRMRAADVEDWLFALLTLQTFEGYFGNTNWGISRMNGGFATRPGVQLISRPTHGGRWVRDVRVILENPDHFREHALPFDPIDGVRLLWLVPWDGTRSLELRELHPLFIEICRRVRLQDGEEDTFRVRAVGTGRPRIQAKEQTGDMADPWTPVLASSRSAFNKRPGYRVVQAALFPSDSDKDRYVPALLQKRHPSDEGHDLAVRFRLLLRGQGKTEGFVERVISVPRAAEVFAFGPRITDAARMCQAMVELASTAQHKVLKPALLRFMQAARERIEFKQPETASWADTWVKRLDQEVDQHFFPCLWECLVLLEDGDEAAAQTPWRSRLVELANGVFEEALQALPLPQVLRPRAVALAEGQFRGAARKHLIPAKTKEEAIP